MAPSEKNKFNRTLFSSYVEEMMEAEKKAVY